MRGKMAKKPPSIDSDAVDEIVTLDENLPFHIYRVGTKVYYRRHSSNGIVKRFDKGGNKIIYGGKKPWTNGKKIKYTKINGIKSEQIEKMFLNVKLLTIDRVLDRIPDEKEIDSILDMVDLNETEPIDEYDIKDLIFDLLDSVENVNNRLCKEWEETNRKRKSLKRSYGDALKNLFNGGD